MTNQLTSKCFTTELLRNNGRLDIIDFNSGSQPMNNMSFKFLRVTSIVLDNRLTLNVQQSFISQFDNRYYDVFHSNKDSSVTQPCMM